MDSHLSVAVTRKADATWHREAVTRKYPLGVRMDVREAKLIYKSSS